MDILTQEFVFSTLASEKNGELFPIDFDEVWKALGYASKQKGKDALIANLIENEDYIIDSTSRLSMSTVGLTAVEARNLTRRQLIMLSTDGYDHFAMMAQTAEGRQARKLFIRYKKAYLEQLERSLNSPVPSSAPEINPQVDPTRFDYCFDAAIQVTNHKNKYSTLQRLLTYLDEGKDYRWEGAKLWLSNPVFYSFVVASRSKKGINTDSLPVSVQIEWQHYCRVCKALRSPINAYFPTKEKTVEGQMRLF